MKTITVKELITRLQDMPPDALVVTGDSGYAVNCFGVAGAADVELCNVTKHTADSRTQYYAVSPNDKGTKAVHISTSIEELHFLAKYFYCMDFGE